MTMLRKSKERDLHRMIENISASDKRRKSFLDKLDKKVDVLDERVDDLELRVESLEVE